MSLFLDYISLTANVRILGHLLRIFFFLFSPKVTRIVEKGCGLYLMVFLTSSKCSFRGSLFYRSIFSFSFLLRLGRPATPFLLPWFQSLTSPSRFPLVHTFNGGSMQLVGSGFLWRRGRGARACSWTHAVVAASLWEEEGLSILSLCICSPYKCARVFRGCSTLFLSLFWVILSWFLFQFSPRIGWSNTNFCWVLQCHFQFKNQHKKLCRYRFRSRQPKTMPLPIQKSTAKTALLPIQKLAAKLCRCRFRNRQPSYIAIDSEIGNNKLSLPIQISVAMGVIFWLYPFLWCLHSPLLK